MDKIKNSEDKKDILEKANISDTQDSLEKNLEKKEPCFLFVEFSNNSTVIDMYKSWEDDISEHRIVTCWLNWCTAIWLLIKYWDKYHWYIQHFPPAQGIWSSLNSPKSDLALSDELEHIKSNWGEIIKAVIMSPWYNKKNIFWKWTTKYKYKTWTENIKKAIDNPELIMDVPYIRNKPHNYAGTMGIWTEDWKPYIEIEWKRHFI